MLYGLGKTSLLGHISVFVDNFPQYGFGHAADHQSATGAQTMANSMSPQPDRN